MSTVADVAHFEQHIQTVSEIGRDHGMIGEKGMTTVIDGAHQEREQPNVAYALPERFLKRESSYVSKSYCFNPADVYFSPTRTDSPPREKFEESSEVSPQFPAH